MSRIISFRGQLADGAQERISLTTIRGLIGYKIVKFELMPPAPGTAHAEWIAKIFTIEQSTIDGLIDFSDNRMLAANYFVENPNTTSPVSIVSIFDNMVFNQDIFITLSDVNGTNACNYYIELEQMDLNMDEATVATLKDIRNND